MYLCDVYLASCTFDMIRDLVRGREGGLDSKVTADRTKPPSSVPSQVMLIQRSLKGSDYYFIGRFSRLVLSFCHSGGLLHHPMIVSFIVLRLV